MTDLSPFAQSVLDAFLGDAEDTGLQMDDLRENVAAALRAAATQAKRAAQPHPSYSEEQFWAFCCGAGTVGGKILAIADELDGINPSESDFNG